MSGKGGTKRSSSRASDADSTREAKKVGRPTSGKGNNKGRQGGGQK